MRLIKPNISLETLYDAVEIANNGIVIADCLQDDMPLIYVNPAFTKITGYEFDEIVGKNCRFLQGPDTDQSEVDILRDSIKNKKKCKVVLINYKKNGQKFWNELSMAPLFNNEGVLTHFIGVQDDISIQKEAENTLIELKLEAENTSILKTEFLNTISHELRTPLTVMLGNIPLLTDVNDMPPSDEIVEIAKDIEESGKHLLKLINELLDISRIEGGKMVLNPEQISSTEIIDEVLNLITKSGLKKGLNVNKNVDDFLFKADPMRLKQVLINLVGNAIKFTDSGEVLIKVFKEKDNAVIQIIDSGIGMKEEDLPYIFDVFRQVDGSATRSAGGSGLGLAITKKLVELHDGHISVKSVYQKGSTFTIQLPL
jgi:PAS domain S-box-containing protein